MGDPERLSEILSAVRDELPSADAETLESTEDIDVAAYASDARDILESNPGAAVEAVGLADTVDDEASIPAAIARGTPDQVRELRAITRLASLADDPEGADADLSELAETLDGPGKAPASPDGDRSDDADSNDDESESEPGPSGESESAESSALGDLLSTTSEDVEAFGDELGSLRDRLTELRDESDTEPEEAEDGADDSEGDASDDGGLLGSGLSDDAGDSSGRSRRYSTLPSSDRADMRAVRRHSTMPRRN